VIALRHSTLPWLIALVLMLVLILASGQARAQNKLDPTPATSTAPADRTAEIEAEIASLKQRIEVLQKELSRLQPRSSTSASAPSAKDDGSRVYSSAMEMLRELPVAARPTPKDGWDAFTLPVAKDWLEKNVTGNRFESLITVGSIKIRRKQPHETAQGSPPWRVTISAQNEQFKFGSATLSQGVFGGNEGFIIDGDEFFAKNAEKIVTGTKLKLTGKIAGITIQMEHGSSVKGGFWIRLTEYEFLAEVLRQRKP
jgi:hypothetical protein